MRDVIDQDGYRPNVGIILSNDQDQLFWAKRLGRRGWQFPQGGIGPGETAEQAMLRELTEEVGLDAKDVEVLGCTSNWLRYRLPRRYVRRNATPVCIGQKQRWFLLRLVGNENRVRLDASHEPEFDAWRWVEFWEPLGEVIYFKRRVYERALRELGEVLFHAGLPPQPAHLRRGSRNRLRHTR